MQALESILADELGYFHHPFLENENKKNTCIICEGLKSKHITGFDD